MVVRVECIRWAVGGGRMTRRYGCCHGIAWSTSTSTLDLITLFVPRRRRRIGTAQDADGLRSHFTVWSAPVFPTPGMTVKRPSQGIA
jgi:hypothetical protein